MARYIDADKIDFRLPYFTDENSGVLVSLQAVKRCIAMTPTADVVPRAEVLKDINEIFIEELIDALEAERQSEQRYRDSALECEKCFEAEIHSYCEDKLDTIITSLQIFKAELKKKYTEDKNNDTSVEASEEAF